MTDCGDDRGPAQALQGMLHSTIKSYVAGSPLNRLKDIDGSPIFEEPLIGFADGDDPLFTLYKQVVGPFHLTPREALGRLEVAPAVGVVSWVLPVARATRESNRAMTEGPSLRWNNMRFQGEDFNNSLRRHVVALLEQLGYTAVAPLLSDQFHTVDTPRGAASTWSERHAAYAAGLGTFSLSDGLITARGIAHRCGSAVLNARLVPSPRPYSSHMEYCPFVQDGTCGACIKRCPAGAITAAGHDKVSCREYLFVGQREWLSKPGYIGHYAGCGLCQTKVPCEARIPRRAPRR
jgi:epoxyqueuosine reductase